MGNIDLMIRFITALAAVLFCFAPTTVASQTIRGQETDLAGWSLSGPAPNGLPENALWFVHQASTYAAYQLTLRDPAGVPRPVHFIVTPDRKVAPLSLAERAQIILAWERATSGPFMGNAPTTAQGDPNWVDEVEGLEIIADSLGDVILGGEIVRIATGFQEAAIQTGVIGTVGYFTGGKAVMRALPDLAKDALWDSVIAKPRKATWTLAAANIVAQRNAIRYNIDFINARREGAGLSPDRPLGPIAIERAYARGAAIYATALPSAELMMALQDDPGTFAQIKRLLRVTVDTAATIADPATLGVSDIRLLLRTDDVFAALEGTVPEVKDYVAEVERRFARLSYLSNTTLYSEARANYIYATAMPGELPDSSPAPMPDRATTQPASDNGPVPEVLHCVFEDNSSVRAQADLDADKLYVTFYVGASGSAIYSAPLSAVTVEPEARGHALVFNANSHAQDARIKLLYSLGGVNYDYVTGVVFQGRYLPCATTRHDNISTWVDAIKNGLTAEAAQPVGALGPHVLITGSNLRAGPSTDFDIRAVGRQWDQVEVLGREINHTGTEWARIRHQSGELAYVSARLLNPLANPSPKPQGRYAPQGECAASLANEEAKFLAGTVFSDQFISFGEEWCSFDQVSVLPNGYYRAKLSCEMEGGRQPGKWAVFRQLDNGHVHLRISLQDDGPAIPRAERDVMVPCPIPE